MDTFHELVVFGNVVQSYDFLSMVEKKCMELTFFFVLFRSFVNNNYYLCNIVE